jgi:hypothetical protein
MTTSQTLGPIKDFSRYRLYTATFAATFTTQITQ